MIHVDLPHGPAGPLARGLAACLSSVTEVPLTDLPDLGDASAYELLGAYKSWLAGRGCGLVPVHDAVELLAIASAAEAPVQIVQQARALAGRGLEGDRYAAGAGTFSPRGGHKPGYELTLIAAEVVEELTTRDARLDFARTRRNVLTRGLDVNALVGREFTIGDVRCRGLRLAEPCAHLERLAGPGLLRPLIHRGGVRVDILTGGTIHTGGKIST